ncbi:HAD family hydrolase [Sulfurimonas sp. HSL-1716]|uniref:HAD family hydrolase n=1 Tax=Hydrocurvibacter sulfurireducens TaxID=3131937 RepID=UPI0031F9C824
MNSNKKFISLCSSSTVEKRFLELLQDPDIKVVSFDIFETLVFRESLNHEEIFLAVGRDPYVKNIFQDEHTFTNFRIAAQKSAKKKLKKDAVAIDEIYDEFSYLTKKQRLKIIKLELHEEKRSLFVNHQLDRWIKIAHDHNKQIILISDMYLSRSDIGKIALSKLKHKTFISDLFISSEFNKSKHTGALYLEVLSRLQIRSHEMLHIGDNQHTDFTMANALGIATLLYDADHYMKSMLRHENYYTKFTHPAKIVPLRILTTLLNPYEGEKERFYYNFGAFAGGPLLHSFSSWVIDTAKKNNIKKIYSIMREGRIFNKYINILLQQNGLDLSLDHIYASRVATYLLTLDEDNIAINDLTFFNFRKLSVNDFYKIFKLDLDNTQLKTYSSVFISDLDNDTLEKIQNDLADKKEVIRLNIQKEKRIFSQYLKQLKITKGSMLLDFGGSGTVQGIIDGFLKHNVTLLHALFYISEDAFEKRVQTRLFPFLPLTNETYRNTQLFRRSPDIFEFLFNGEENTTISFEKHDHQIIPILSENSLSQEYRSIINAFDAGIDAYFEVIQKYGSNELQYEQSYILKLLSRIVDFPTYMEIQQLGDLPLELNYTAENTEKIIDKRGLDFLNRNGLENVMNDFYDDLSRYFDELPWPQGAAGKTDIKYIQQNRYIYKQNINDFALENILLQIDSNGSLRSLSIYGTGDFLLLVMPELLRRGIKINYLIDSKAENGNFTLYNYEVITAKQALLKGESNFLIASVAFSKEISAKLSNLSKEIRIICF